MSFSKEDDITDLIVPESDLLIFNTPKFNAVRAAYSKNFKAAPKSKDLLKRINEIFPMNSKKLQKKNKEDESEGFSIDKDDDPLIL